MSSPQKSLTNGESPCDRPANSNGIPAPPDSVALPAPPDEMNGTPGSPASSHDSFYTALSSHPMPELVPRMELPYSSPPAFGAAPAFAEQNTEDLGDHEIEANKQKPKKAKPASKNTANNNSPQLLVGSNTTVPTWVGRQQRGGDVDFRSPVEPSCRQRTQARGIPSNRDSFFTRSPSPSPNPFDPYSPLISPHLHPQINRTAQSSQGPSSGTHNSARPVSKPVSSQAIESQYSSGTKTTPSRASSQFAAIPKSTSATPSKRFQGVRCYECAKAHAKCEGPIPTCVRCTRLHKGPDECFRQPRGNGIKNPPRRDGRDPGPKDRKPGLRKRKRDDDDEEWGKRGGTRRALRV